MGDDDEDTVTHGPLLDGDRGPAALGALFLGIALLNLGNGLQGTVVGIRTQTEGFDTLITGLVMSAYFVGFLAGTRLISRFLMAVGHIRVFAALASLASTAAIVHALVVHPLSWGVLRLLTGLCMSGLFVVAESWINELATNANRGRLLAIYMVVTMGSMGIGQLLLNVASPQGFDLFVIASVLVSLSLVPITLSATSGPQVDTPTPMAFRELARIIPTGLMVALIIGGAHGVLLGLGAVYATSVGLGPSQVALFVGAPTIGAVVLQLPIGQLSDRIPRRPVMVAVAVAATAVALTLGTVTPGSGISFLLMFILGGLTFPLYSLAVAYTNDWLAPNQMMAASAALVLTVGAGAAVGPAAAAPLMARYGSDAFFVALATLHGAVAGYILYRMVTVDAPTADEQGPYVAVPARASLAAGLLFPRPRRRRTRRPESAEGAPD